MSCAIEESDRDLDEGAFGCLQLGRQIGNGIGGDGHRSADFTMGRFAEFDVGAAQDGDYAIGPIRIGIEQPLAGGEFGEGKLGSSGYGSEVVEVFRAVGQGEDGIVVLAGFEFQQACEGDFVQVHAGKIGPRNVWLLDAMILNYDLMHCEDANVARPRRLEGAKGLRRKGNRGGGSGA